MTTEPTPAIERAAAAALILEHGMNAALYAPHHDDAAAVLSAALDVEEMAQAIRRNDQNGHLNPSDWADAPEWVRESYRADARAVRASILGDS